MIITIDGPAGAGKSSAAKALAKRLGFDFLDTGAMYRAVTLAGLRAKCNVTSEEALGRLLDGMRLEMPSGRVLLDGEDVTDAIRAPEVTAASAAVASSPVVRRRLVAMQQAIARGQNMVCEGRDQGTLVFPDAACKFFLVADPVERALRRHRDLEARGDNLPFENVLSAQEERDRRDAARDIAPMVPAADAVEVDSTHLTLDEVVELMEREVRRQMTLVPKPSSGTARETRSQRSLAADGNSIIPRFNFGSSFHYEATSWLSSVCMSLGFSLRAEGSRFIPREGPALLVANHQSLLDPLVVGLASPRHLCYLARKTLFRNPFLAWFIRGLNAVPIDHQGIGKEGIKAILQLLKAGRAVLVFPEGHRTHDGQMQPLRPGVQLLLKKTAAPVIPIGIAGAYEAWPRWRKYPLPAPLFAAPRPGTLAVSIGPPLDSRRLAALPRQETLQELVSEMQSRVARAERLRRK